MTPPGQVIRQKNLLTGFSPHATSQRSHLSEHLMPGSCFLCFMYYKDTLNLPRESVLANFEAKINMMPACVLLI